MKPPQCGYVCDADSAPVCDQCDAVFQPCSFLRKRFCSFECESKWAEEHNECAIKSRGRFPRIAYVDAEECSFPEHPTALVEEIQNADLFTFLQHPAEFGIHWKYRAEGENLAVLSVSTFDHWWTKQVDKKTRNLVRKAEKKGVVVTEEPISDELVQAIQEMYNESPMRQGRQFRYYRMDLEEVRKRNSEFPLRSIFLVARLAGRIIGFAKLIQDHRRTYATIISILALLSHRDDAAMNALVAQAVKVCAERGISQLSYGRFQYGNKTEDGLLQFKKNNGFERLDLPRYYVPLNWRGKLTLKLGLHRAIRERIPEYIAKPLRLVRGHWLGKG